MGLEFKWYLKDASDTCSLVPQVLFEISTPKKWAENDMELVVLKSKLLLQEMFRTYS